ncbi:hypothetical protein HMPREF0027_1649 [Actinobacillus ureae ATCC 25976]|uniref:Uncharacterized protein n=1 Tax=Actinobacillus ureae ATCC 25976 TaxID=887324 RepID=E8KII2_9PAST|nr:hypothetical protein HMPREF0027_1649 [Actinobacillus ureae ATCC 25976]
MDENSSLSTLYPHIDAVFFLTFKRNNKKEKRVFIVGILLILIKSVF